MPTTHLAARLREQHRPRVASPPRLDGTHDTLLRLTGRLVPVADGVDLARLRTPACSWLSAACVGNMCEHGRRAA